ncbi:MAG: glycerol-3-phosphate dehydrogenase/oxidase [Syntrophobacteraceae bacterium]|nr:glycerol-3-phosphate dehydrogenase/oxidase [Desulfobacteraceae bacterium]
MKRDLSSLASQEYDVIVLGAGAFGSCAAWEAASRGLSVALVERGDFCCATSANHLKMVHGGIRYLQHADIQRVRESCRERSILLRIAPHLVRPIPILMPTYGNGMQGREVLGAGLLLYDLITSDRNRGLGDEARRIPRGRIISRDECLEVYPHLKQEGLTGAGVFFDAQFYNPPRLALAFLRSAVMAGACIGNYCEAVGFVRKHERICGVRVRDVLTGAGFDIRGKMVLNAAGPWADRLLADGASIRLRPVPSFSRDLGFVVRRPLARSHALAIQLHTKDPDAVLSRKGRHVFVVPWREYSLVGVWHKVHKSGPDGIGVREEEIRGYIDEVNASYPAFAITLEDVSMINTGLTLFGENSEGAEDLSFGKRSLLIDHAREYGVEGLVTLIGVRATTARGMAEKAVDLIFRKLGKAPAASRTSTTRIYGGKIDDFEGFLQQAGRQNGNPRSMEVMRHLAHNYGARYGEVLRYTGENPAWGATLGESQVIGAEVVHAVREEMAQKLEDVVFRRTDLGTGAYPGESSLRACTAVMADEMKWDEARREREIREVMSHFPRYGS